MQLAVFLKPPNFQIVWPWKKVSCSSSQKNIAWSRIVFARILDQLRHCTPFYRMAPSHRRMDWLLHFVKEAVRIVLGLPSWKDLSAKAIRANSKEFNKPANLEPISVNAVRLSPDKNSVEKHVRYFDSSVRASFLMTKFNFPRFPPPRYFLRKKCNSFWFCFFATKCDEYTIKRE